MPRGVLEYLRFVSTHRRLLGFGLITLSLSGFGQTFYLGLFNPQMREAFGLSHGTLGLVYGAATLAGATVLSWVGRYYDRVALGPFLSGAALILALGCVLLALAPGVGLLLLALFLLRLGGQGLMGHIALTTMAHRFHGGRGKATSVPAMGLPLAEASFPLLAVTALAVFDWRSLWAASAGLVLLVFLPVLLILLRDSGEGDARAAPQQWQGTDHTLVQVLRDWRFYLLIPGSLAAPFVVTIAFFHQIPMAQAKGWSTELVATGLSLFALGHIGALIAGGPLVDRWSARRVFSPALLPLAASMAVLAGLDARWAALLWPALLGIGMGLLATAVNALLAELYGVTHLGAIRGVLQALMIGSTAVGPPLIGWALDYGVGTGSIAGTIAAAIVLAAVLGAVASGQYRQTGATPSTPVRNGVDLPPRKD